MRYGAVWVLVGALAVATGCATTSPPAEKSIRDFKQVAGTWRGWTTSTSGSALRATLVIQPNGSYLLTVEQNAAFPGQLTPLNGVLRYGEGTTGRWKGRVALVEDRGKEYLRFVHDTGELWTEYERAQ
jgi:hypothetical protein